MSVISKMYTLVPEQKHCDNLTCFEKVMKDTILTLKYAEMRLYRNKAQISL